MSIAIPNPQTGIHTWQGHSEGGKFWEVHRGDAIQVLEKLDDNSVQCAVTSPPYYWQRDYKVEGQIGLEPEISGYVKSIVSVMNTLRSKLRNDGVLFLNLGDTYYSAKGMPRGKDPKNKARRLGLRAVDGPGLGVPRKSLIGIPWRVALAMIDDGWVLRSPIIWQRKTSIPEPSSKDRPWRTYEHVFLFAKRPRYKFHRAQLDGREDIWDIDRRPKGSKGLHSAAFPEELAETCIKAATDIDDLVIDPFAGTGTTLASALKLGRRAVGIDLSDEYCRFAVERLSAL